MRQLILLLMLTITSAVYAYEPLITEDKIWEYKYTVGTMFPLEWTSNLKKIKFDGTTERNGKIYHNLKQIFSVKGHGDSSEIIDEITDDSEYTIALLREENGVIYEYNETEGGATNDNEVLIYDFTVDAGESYHGIISPPPHNGVGMFDDCVMNITCVSKEYNQDINGYIYTLRLNDLYNLDFYDYINCTYYGECDSGYAYVAEGIGNIAEGRFTRISCKGYTGYTSNDYTIWGLRKVYDLSGNVIFDAEKWKSSISTVASEPSAIVGKTYDLTGREIRNPLPGTVYIRDGRKAVAR